MLTSIGLDHTEWLGETELEIAAEKLAVLRDQTTLVLGRVSPAVAELAERTAAERGARLLRAPEDPGPELRLLAPGGFQRRNFALARTAAEAFLGELDPALVERVAATLPIPGRLEQVAEHPPTFIDAAHNPDGAAALAEALPALSAGRRVVACLAILADKDARAMIQALAPALTHAICTQLPADGPKSRPGGDKSAHRPSVPAEALAEMCREAGVGAEAEASFEVALRRASALAAEAPEGVLLVAGSNYGIAPARAALRAVSAARNVRGFGHGSRRRLPTAVDDGPRRRRRRDRDPRLLRHRLPVRTPLPLAGAPAQARRTGFAAGAEK